ncbi:MFS transporter [Krasilnikoviella flava]|uniref:Drug resistance transporter, EmrB/QacA subfamily n=1 Tax=Krasilnikoviella flava TaxID=526729 RepID=A0A1T5KVY2_9MICO|nr:MFS transporter [Krasilnikoviella flava]SKC67867.1 drug resistance transporter, EmrB/QacA subfamily [Krasilnikoviella flava]
MSSRSVHPSRSTGGAFAALLLAVLSFSLLQTLIVPALPALERDLHADTGGASWLISAFLVASSVGTVILGRLGDIFGRKRLLLVSLGILAAGSLLAALSESLGLLIAARAVQGLGAGTFPLAFGLVRELFTKERVPVVIGTISAAFGIGFGVGLVAPGPLIDAFGWPSLFWVSLILVAVAAAAVLAFIPAARHAGAGQIDWAGATVLSVALVALLLGISQARTWGALATMQLIVLAVVAFIVFVLLERRVPAPLMNLGVLRRRPVAAANLTALIIGFGMYGAFTLVPQLVQTPVSAGYGFGATVTSSGLYLLPMAVTMLFAGPVAGRLGPRIGYTTTLVIACLISAVGFGLLAIGLDQGWAIATGAGIIGIGIGLAFSVLANVVVAAVEPHETGEATGVNTIVRTIGGAIGAQTAAAIVTAHLTSTGHPDPAGYTIAFAVSAISLVLAALAGLLGGTRKARR